MTELCDVCRRPVKRAEDEFHDLGAAAGPFCEPLECEGWRRRDQARRDHEAMKRVTRWRSELLLELESNCSTRSEA